MREVTYIELVRGAVELVKAKYGSVSAFARSEKLLKKDGTPYPETMVSNLLSLPKNGDKVLKSYHFLKQVYALFGKEFKVHKEIITKIYI
jgi:flavoprotein